MALKTFNELRQVDLGKYIQLKPTFYKDNNGKMQKNPEDKWLEYIEWAVVLDLLYQSGAERVAFTSEPHPTLINTLVICLTIDGMEFRNNYPIISGNSVLATPNQLQIHNAEVRGFVKSVAINTGLGLELWMKEERVTSDFLTESHSIKLNAKTLLQNAASESELVNIWKAMSEDEQLKYKDVFANRKKEILG